MYAYEKLKGILITTRKRGKYGHEIILFFYVFIVRNVRKIFQNLSGVFINFWPRVFMFWCGNPSIL